MEVDYITFFWCLCHDVADIIDRACAKHRPKTLRALKALCTQAGTPITRLFTMSDQVNSGGANCKRSCRQQTIGQNIVHGGELLKNS
jgi:hypothetical protein